MLASLLGHSWKGEKEAGRESAGFWNPLSLPKAKGYFNTAGSTQCFVSLCPLLTFAERVHLGSGCEQEKIYQFKVTQVTLHLLFINQTKSSTWYWIYMIKNPLKSDWNAFYMNSCIDLWAQILFWWWRISYRNRKFARGISKGHPFLAK